MQETGTIRNEQGQFIKGVSGNPEGRKPDTLEDKIIKKATKELIAEYKEGLTKALSQIQPILIAKALEGDVPAIKEIHDRTMDKAKQSTEISGELNEKRTLVIIKDGEHNKTSSEANSSI